MVFYHLFCQFFINLPKKSHANTPKPQHPSNTTFMRESIEDRPSFPQLRSKMDFLLLSGPSSGGQEMMLNGISNRSQNDQTIINYYLHQEIPIIFNSINMDYAAILSYQTMYLPGAFGNDYSFGLSCPSMTYNFPYYQASPSFAYCFSNPTGSTESQVNTPQTIAGEDHIVQPELGPKLRFLRNCRKIKATQEVVKYAKKNAESNVINQIFSYLSIRGKSQRVLSGLLNNNEELIALFYLIMRQLKKNNKKYINRNYIKSLLEMDGEHTLHLILAKNDPKKKLGVEKLRTLLRIMVRYYLRNVCINAILTSSKLDKDTKNEHLQRRADVLCFLDYHIRSCMENK